MSFKRITDIRIPELALYTDLNEPQLLHYYEPDTGLFICESPNVIMRALDAGYEPVSMVTEERFLAEKYSAGNFSEAYVLSDPSIRVDDQYFLTAKRTLERILDYADIPIYTGELSVLKELTGYSLTRGMLCAMRRRPLLPADQLTAGKRRVAVLESISNPTNVGAIFRSAAALSMDAVLLTRDCADPLYRRAARVSMGTVFQIPWTYIESCRKLHELGYKTAAMALTDDAKDLHDPALKEEGKLAVILGNEGCGLSADTIKQADHVIKIPMQKGVDSLNVAAASAVVFWELSKS